MPLTTDELTTGANVAPAASALGGGVGAAKPIRARRNATEQRTNARKIRGLKKPDSGFSFIRFSFSWLGGMIVQMIMFEAPSNWSGVIASEFKRRPECRKLGCETRYISAIGKILPSNSFSSL
jgi:hypothetical protein